MPVPLLIPAGTVTSAQREDMYRRIFQGIPRSFLDPEHPDNKAIIAAIAHACAYTELVVRKFESGMFLDTANNQDVGSDGLSSLARWGVWLQMPQIPGETEDAYRLRIMHRLFTPRTTIAAIEAAVLATCGVPVSIEEPSDQVVRMNDGPWAGRKLLGRRYGYMVINVITEGATNGLPPIMQFLRAAGVHWSHIERVAHMAELSWDAGSGTTNALAWDWTTFRRPAMRPGSPFGGPMVPRYLFGGAESAASDHRASWSARTYLVNADSDLITPTIEAMNDNQASFPVLNWDDNQTLWGESVWEA